MKYGFIGSGNMGGALATAVCKAVDPMEVALANRTAKKAESLAAALGCTCATNEEIAKEAEFIFLGVKPQMMASLASEIKDILTARTSRFVLVSMAAGLSIDDIKSLFRMDAPVVRLSPNTPVAIGEGIVLYTASFETTESEKQDMAQALSECGLVTEIPENLHAIGGTLSGCSPAFTDMFVEALADGAVACGLPRAQAMQIAAQMIVGTGKLLLASGKHPGELKDAVCSPGGTTIQGVRTLEEKGFRAAAMDAVIASYEKTLNLKK